MRRVDELIAAAHALVAHPVFHRLADEAALGVPENEPRAGDFLDAEQVKLLAEHAVVARLDFFQLLEVRVKVFRVVERRSVETLQLLIFFVAEPVRARKRGELERLDARCRRNVRSTAKVSECAVFVERNFVAVFGEALDEVHLHELACAVVVRERAVAGFGDAYERLVTRDDFLPCALQSVRGRIL